MKYPQVYFHQYITRPDMETLRHKYRQKMDGKTRSGDNTRLGRTVVVGPFALRNDVPPEVLAREGVGEIIQTYSRCLSKFEVEILNLYLSGLSYSEIAELCGKTDKSVDNAVQRIRRKLAQNLYLSDISEG